MLTMGIVILVVLVFSTISWVIACKVSWSKCISANKIRWQKTRKAFSVKEIGLQKRCAEWENEKQKYQTDTVNRAYESAKNEILDTLRGHVEDNLTAGTGTLTFGDIQQGLSVGNCQAWPNFMGQMGMYQQQGHGDSWASYFNQLGLGQQQGPFGMTGITEQLLRQLGLK